jgi:hypothetical protein
MMYVAQNAPRVARALFEIALRRRWPSAAATLLEVCKVCALFWLMRGGVGGGCCLHLQFAQHTHTSRLASLITTHAKTPS